MIISSIDLADLNISGLIHSVFQNAINLIYDDKKLITIINEHRIMLPYSIKFPYDLFQQLSNKINVSDKFELNNNMLKFDDSVFYHLTIFDARKNKKIKEAHLKKIKYLITPLIKKKNDIYTKIFDTDNLTNIIDLLIKKNEHLCDYLISRGFGLTPSGDDIINGIIYYQQNNIDKDIITKDNILKNLEKTNIFSQNMLTYALKNKFNEFFFMLSQLLEYSDESHIKKFINSGYGASSAIDTMIGLCFADYITDTNTKII